MIQLTKRLQSIADRIPQGCRIADIGSDHALLPTYLAEQKRISFAVAGEVNAGPFAAAQRQVLDSGVSKLVDVRRGDGLAVIAPGEVDVIVIAGMGGSLITRILSDGKEKLTGVRRLVLQPNISEDAVREWLHEHGWRLSEETLLEEAGRLYEILVAERAADTDTPHRLYDPCELPCGLVVGRRTLLRMGPYLLREGGELFIRKWSEEARKMRRICAQLMNSDTPEARQKYEQMMNETKITEEVLACLQKDKRSFK